MTIFIPQEKIEEIKDRISIVDVVSDYVHLKKIGNSYKGLCPFHSEKTPSFSVSEEKGVFHCFGCKASGNVFNFVMKISNMSFSETIEELAKRCGIQLPKGIKDKEDSTFINELMGINNVSAEYFHKLLLESPVAKRARDYLVERGIESQTIDAFKLGYSLDSWNGLYQYLLSKKIKIDLAEKLGLIIAKKTEGYYDRFRGRLIFSIFNINNKITAFGGRVLNDSLPKYLNSPESEIFIKGKTFYGLNIAKEFFRKEDRAIIVEGYFDLILLHQNGIKNSVATLGTALTSEHIRIIKRYTKNIITIFDSDEAGVKASERALEPFLDNEISPSVTVLPQGHDPDSYIREVGGAKFKEKIDNAQPLIEYFIENNIKFSGHFIKERLKSAENIIPILGKIKNVIEKDLYIKKASEKLGVSEITIRNILKSELKTIKAKSPSLMQLNKDNEVLHPAEKIVVKLMIEFEDIIPRIINEDIISQFSDEKLKSIAQFIIMQFNNCGKFDSSLLFNSIDNEELKHIFSRLIFEESEFKKGNIEKPLNDCLKKIKLDRLKTEHSLLSKEISKAQQDGNEFLWKSLLTKKSELIKKVKQLH